VSELLQAQEKGYLTHESRVTSARIRAEAELADNLLAGTATGEDTAHDLSVPHGMFLLTCAGPPGEGAARRLRQASAALQAAVPDALATPVRNHPHLHAVVLVPVPAATSWEALTDEVERLAVAHEVIVLPVGPGPTGELGQVYDETVPLVRLAAAFAGRPGVVTIGSLADYYLASHLTPAILADHLGNAAAALLGLSLQRRERAVALLQALCDCDHNMGAVAHQLGTTPGAVSKRVSRLEDKLGVSRNAAGGRRQLDLVLHVVRLAEAGLLEVERHKPSTTRTKSRGKRAK